MRALQVQRLSEDFTGVALSEIEPPRPGPDQVLIRTRAASLNFPDLLMSEGKYQHQPRLPFTLGGDLAGVVESVGDGIRDLRAGDEVCAIGLGAFADQAVYQRSTVTTKPARLDFPEAAAFGAAYLTAYVALVERARLQQGEWVLIHGASGGMGLAAVDLAKALGARVIAASSSDEKLARVKELYGPHELLKTSRGFRDEVLEITNGAGADVIFDPVNGPTFLESIRCTAFDGRLLVVGFASGDIVSVKSNHILIKGLSVVGVRAGEYGRHFPDRRKRILAELHQLAQEERIRPHVHAAIPLENWREAFEMMRARDVVGKIVLTL
jgi:NADPH2:quinone reductase